MTATGAAIMEVDLGSVAGSAVDRFLDGPLARGLNGETAVDCFLDAGVATLIGMMFAVDCFCRTVACMQGGLQ